MSDMSEEELNQLAELSVEQLAVLAANAQKMLTEKRQAKRTEAIAQIKEIAAAIGVKVEIEGEKGKRNGGGGKTKGGKVPAKYSDGNGNFWTGRGVKPKWLSEALEAGLALESFLITQPEAEAPLQEAA